jgi:hypothetical protein
MITMMGRKSVKAMKTKKMVKARKRPKYMSTFSEGKLLMAFWKLTHTLGLLDTLWRMWPAYEIKSKEKGGSDLIPESSWQREGSYELKVPETVSLVVRMTTSMPKGSMWRRTSSSR